MSTNDCYEAIVDSASAGRRMRRCAESARVLDAYQRAHDAAAEVGLARPECRAGLQAALADRAFEAEEAVRTLIADHLQTLNELRDAGQLERSIAEAGRIASQKDFAWRETLADVEREVDEKLGIEPGMFNRAAELIERHGFKVISAGAEGTVEGEIRNESGRPERFTVRGSTRPGDPGRVSVDDLLGPGGITAVIPVPVPDDCHSLRSLLASSQEKTTGAYEANVAGLALAREAAYRHARTMAEVGPSAFRGEDVFTAVAIVLVAVAVLLIGAGAVMVALGDQRGWFVMGVGVIFLAGGICVAAGQCEFIVTAIVQVQA